MRCRSERYVEGTRAPQFRELFQISTLLLESFQR